MEYIITIFLAVMAQVIGHYVCKWLDRQHHDNEPKIKIRGMELLGFFVISMAIITVFLVNLL